MDRTFYEVEKLIGKQSRINFASTHGEKHTEYQKTYFCTNEFIDHYLKIYDISDKSNALSVTASGDQIFNLISNGIYNIDTFDSNKLCEYLVFGLKRAMILKYSYREYLDFNNILYNGKIKYKSDESRTIISDLLPYMDEKYRMFWKKVIDIDYNIQKYNDSNISIFNLLYFSFKPACFLVEANTYLLSEIEYNRLKNNLGKANITYTHGNAYELDSIFRNKEYDLILLSNIFDYFYKFYKCGWEYEKLKAYILKIEKLAKNDGIIFINYLFNLECYLEKEIENIDYTHLKLGENYGNFRVINNSCIKFQNLTDEEVYLFRTLEKNINDGIILKRVQK